MTKQTSVHREAGTDGEVAASEDMAVLPSDDTNEGIAAASKREGIGRSCEEDIPCMREASAYWEALSCTCLAAVEKWAGAAAHGA